MPRTLIESQEDTRGFWGGRARVPWGGRFRRKIGRETGRRIRCVVREKGGKSPLFLDLSLELLDRSEFFELCGGQNLGGIQVAGEVVCRGLSHEPGDIVEILVKLLSVNAGL